VNGLGYLGAAVAWFSLGQLSYAAEKPICAACHPKETALYSKSAMGRSIISPAPLPPAQIKHDLSQSTISCEQRGSQLIHGI